MNAPRFNYDHCIELSERLTWKIEDILGDSAFDYTRPFLPETLAQVTGIACLSETERTKLNQLRGLSYAHLFGFVEEFIVRQIHALAGGYGPDRSGERRGLLRFTEEEVKHQILFDRTKDRLLDGLGRECGLVPGAEGVADFVMGKGTLSVLLLTAMLEWVTQLHYTDAFRSSEERERLDPIFVRIFKAHWLEEAQHTKMDQIEIQRFAGAATQAERDAAVDAVLEIGGAFDGLLKAQAELDIASLERVCARTFSAEDKAEILAKQHKAYRYTFLVSGLTHPNVIETIGAVSKAGVDKFAATASALSA